MKSFTYLQQGNCRFVRYKLLIFAVVVLTVINTFCGGSSTFAAAGAKVDKQEARGTRASQASLPVLLSQRGTSEPQTDHWTLTFDGGFGSSHLNTAIWNIADARPDGYLGCCLSALGSQTFTSQDISLNQGVMRITSEKRSLGGKNYTSGAITTDNKFSLLYGRVDISARLPKGQGMWPAFWMLTGNTDHEIDLMEMINTPTTIYQTYHFSTSSSYSSVSQCRVLEPDLSTGFHLYSLIWKPASITWYIDGTQTCQVTASIPQTPMYLLLNTAVGGTWSGQPDATTVFPQYTDVGYVRVYQSAPYTDCLGLQVTSPLQLQTTIVTPGQTINAAVTYTNRCTMAFTLNNLIVAARTPDGGNADLGNTSGPMTLQPGQSLTVNASRLIKSTDPAGQWYAFSSFQTLDGSWHADGTNLVNFTVTG